MSEKLFLEFGNGTDTGCVRKDNEDAFMLFEAGDKRQKAAKGHLAIICDGMGGALGGKTASKMTLEEVASIYYGSRTGDVRTAITQAIKSANQHVYQKSNRDSALKGMGTTIVAAMLIENQAFIAHVGDSRCYLIRNNEIFQMTEDHTVVQKMVRQGLLSPDEARSHPDGHILNRSVGVSDELEVDLTMEPIELEANDILLLCSDGLTTEVQDDEILEIAANGTAQRAVEQLIALARERGGRDNITIQIIRVHEHELDPGTDTGTFRTAPLRKRMSYQLMFSIIALVVLLAATGILWFLGFFNNFF